MAFEVSKKPVISKRTLDDENLIVVIDTESKTVKIESRIIDEYSTGKKFFQRVPVVLRNAPRGEAKFESALSALFPGKEYATFIGRVMALYAQELSK